MKKGEYEKELKETMQELKKAWKRCLEVFENGSFDCNEYIVENYPFNSSFDEIDVIDWCDTIIDNIKEQNIELKDEYIDI